MSSKPSRSKPSRSKPGQMNNFPLEVFRFSYTFKRALKLRKILIKWPRLRKQSGASVNVLRRQGHICKNRGRSKPKGISPKSKWMRIRHRRRKGARSGMNAKSILFTRFGFSLHRLSWINYSWPKRVSSQDRSCQRLFGNRSTKAIPAINNHRHPIANELEERASKATRQKVRANRRNLPSSATFNPFTNLYSFDSRFCPTPTQKNYSVGRSSKFADNVDELGESNFDSYCFCPSKWTKSEKSPTKCQSLAPESQPPAPKSQPPAPKSQPPAPKSHQSKKQTKSARPHITQAQPKGKLAN